MSRQIDLAINRNIRKILVRHWIDLGRLSIRTTMGKVFVRGSLQRISGSREDLTSPIVEAIFHDMKRTRDVRIVSADLENWTNEGGKWRPSKEDRKKHIASRHIGSRSRTYTLDKKTEEEKKHRETDE
jgi:hypothetical protein